MTSYRKAGGRGTEEERHGEERDVGRRERKSEKDRFREEGGERKT